MISLPLLNEIHLVDGLLLGLAVVLDVFIASAHHGKLWKVTSSAKISDTIIRDVLMVCFIQLSVCVNAVLDPIDFELSFLVGLDR